MNPLMLARAFVMTLALAPGPLWGQTITVKAPAEADPRNWKEYAPGEGFSVLMPGTPKKQIQETPLPNGKTATLHIHSLNTFAEYGVIYADYPFAFTGAEMAKRILDAGAQGAIDTVNAELLHIEEISLGDHPGRALKERLPDGKIMRVRIFLVGSRLYQVAITTPKEDDAPTSAVKFHETVAARFLDSFKLKVGQAAAGQAPLEATDRLLAPPSVEGEVDRLMKELRARNEVVLGFCEDLEKCKPLAGNTKFEVGKIINKPPPTYPPIAKAARAQGSVRVQLIVDEEGKVSAAQAVSGHPLLQMAAVKAAREVLFTPSLMDGKPVKVSGVITYDFVLK